MVLHCLRAFLFTALERSLGVVVDASCRPHEESVELIQQIIQHVNSTIGQSLAVESDKWCLGFCHVVATFPVVLPVALPTVVVSVEPVFM